LIVKQALEHGHQVVAYVRRVESILDEHPNLHIVVGGLTETKRIKDALKGADACISALGGNSLTQRSPEFTDGIARIVLAMEQVGVLRFIYLSSFGAGESKYFIPQPMRFFIADLFLRVPLADHTKNEKRIAQSNLKWTSVRPGGLTDVVKVAQLKHGVEKPTIKGNPSISRTNVAKFIVQQLTDETYLNASVWLYEQ
jgi:uncharacterized protein YbjT (DUF2867 family)